jgi:hypothetical protein
MSIRQKLLYTVAAHPKLTAFVIGLSITMAVGMATGMQHLAFASGNAEPPGI